MKRGESMKWIERLCAIVAYGVLAIFILGLVIAISVWIVTGYEEIQISRGDIGYSIVSKETVVVEGKSGIHIEAYLATYPVGIENKVLEKGIVKAILKIKKEYPEVDQIYIRGYSSGLMDVKECYAFYYKKNPNEVSFTNYGWYDNKEADYRKKLVLPEMNQ